MNENFDLIRKENRLLYEYIRGSQLYNLANEKSDTDLGGIYICNPNDILGFKNYKPQVSDSKHDTTWFEIGEYIRLLLKSNPTVLEALFVPQHKIIGEISPIMKALLENRNEFLTKECFNPFFGYAQSQITKARGLNKKIVNLVNELLTPYDFIYTFKGQGSTKIKNWLANHGLKQEYCGLVNIPNMHNIYGLYYDWGMHIEKEHCIAENGTLLEGHETFINTLQKYFNEEFAREAITRVGEPIGYRGIIAEDGSSKELRLSSIDDKNTKPLCFISYNQSGYSLHCQQYKDYQTWVKERNPVRYESNLNQNYDGKNMCHCFRMIHMAKEIASGEGLILERTWDRDFLLDIRNHKFEYDNVIEMLEQEKNEMNNLMANSTIKEKIDTDFVNDLLIDIRKNQLKCQY